MKLVSPCCKNIQEYKPRKPFDWSKRHKTACKKCSINFDVSKDLVVVGESEEKKGEKETITLAKGKPSNTEDLAHIIESIENPVAFASAHIFKKMIETGDVRWAQLYVSVLDKTKKLDYETIKEEQWLKQANNMSMDDLVSRVAMKGSTSKNILRRLEEAEDTSVYDNF